ncbi:MAG: CYTH domain-containing protein [Erysipelotrichaceae bacterium]|nr:CYTH domain-containing protein [Erysipelotrichaceae bacterium]
MSSNIEIEAKVLLLKDEYNAIIEKLNLQKYRKIKQTNHYIDTPDRYLKKNGIALRIREKDEEFELTLKTPLSEGLLEKNENISWRDFENLSERQIFPDGNIRKFLLILGVKVSDLKVLTSLCTERIHVEFEGFGLALDKNIYSNIVDYELEVESSSIERAQQEIENILNECDIKNFSFNKVSKQARALNALEK